MEILTFSWTSGFRKGGGRAVTDLGNKLMESMFNAWCDDECKEFTPDHNDYSHSLPEIVDYISKLTGASRE